MTSRQESPLRAGIVGAGYVSAYHLRALRSLKNVTIAGIADPDTTRARQMAERFGIPRVCGSLRELAAAGLDVAHILTPPPSHCALTVEALELGCHVLVEKPMALSVEECDAMIVAAAQAGRVLAVNHSAKWDPAVQKALALVRNGAIGEILAVDYLRGSDYPPYAGGPLPIHYRDGGYPFRDIGIHALYLLESFLGPIRGLEAWYRTVGRDPNLLFDEWHVVAECPRGIGHAHLSWNARPMQNELLIRGAGGVLSVDLMLQTLTLRKALPLPKPAELAYGAVSSSLSRLWQTVWNVGRFATGRLLPSPDIHNAVRHFYSRLTAPEKALDGAEEGRRMVSWVELVARRADEEKRVQRPVLSSRRASILVTGATGFLGRALVSRLLQSGETLRLLVRRPPEPAIAEHPRVEVAYGDLGDPQAVDRAVDGVDLVYHAGATTNGGWTDFERGTVWGTRNIVSSCSQHGVRRLVYVSSLSVLDYASLQAGTPVDETAALEPYPERRGSYTRSKLEAEQIVLAAIREQGLPAVILRPGQIFGPGAETVPPYGTVSVGRQWIVMGSGGLTLPLVYVEDVIDALVAAAESPDAVGSILQLVDADTVTQRQYLDSCLAYFKDRIRVRYAPMPLMYAMAGGLEILGRLLGRGVPLTRYRLRSIKGIRHFNCAAARDRLGWQPRTGVRAGMELTFLGTENRGAAEQKEMRVGPPEST